MSPVRPTPSQPLGPWLEGGEGGKDFRSGPWVGSLAESSQGGTQDEASVLGRAGTRFGNSKITFAKEKCKVHRRTEWLRLAGTSGVHLAGARDHLPMVSE